MPKASLRRSLSFAFLAAAVWSFVSLLRTRPWSSFHCGRQLLPRCPFPLAPGRPLATPVGTTASWSRSEAAAADVGAAFSPSSGTVPELAACCDWASSRASCSRFDCSQRSSSVLRSAETLSSICPSLRRPSSSRRSLISRRRFSSRRRRPWSRISLFPSRWRFRLRGGPRWPLTPEMFLPVLYREEDGLT